MNKQAQGKFVHPVAFGEGKRASYKASKTLAQGVVEAFDMAVFARALAGAAMGAPGEDLGVSQPQIAAAISGFGHADDTAFCHWLVQEIGVVAVPGSSFFAEPVHGLIRFHFAKKEETLHAVGERLLRLREKA